MDDMRRSLPTSPYDMDPRDPRDPRGMSSSYESRLAMDGPDYFSAMGMGPFSNRSPGGPFPPPGFDPGTYMGNNQQQIDDLVRRCVFGCAVRQLKQRR